MVLVNVEFFLVVRWHLVEISDPSHRVSMSGCGGAFEEKIEKKKEQQEFPNSVQISTVLGIQSLFTLKV